MPNPYALIFSVPGSKGFSSAAFIGRLPIAMAPIGIVAMLSQTHGDYWLAGAVSATFALANAVIAPQLSRLVDRYGQARIAAPATAISALAFLGLVVAVNQQWPIWTLFVFALLGAFMPSLSAMVRARLPQPTTVKIDAAVERLGLHPGIGNGQYASARNAANDEPPLIHISSITQMVDDGIDICNGALETGDRNLHLAGIAGAVLGQSFAI